MKSRVILVHGAFCGGWAFEAFQARLEARGAECVAPDLPGHDADADAVDVANLSMSDYAAAICALAQAEAAPPIVIGHSLGGLVAQMVATRVRLAGLGLLAPSAPWGIAGQSFEEAASAFSLFTFGPYWTQAIEPDRSLAKAYSLDRMAPERSQAVMARMRAESGRALFETLNWWMDPFMTTRVDPKAVACPVFAAVGSADHIHPPATVRQTALRLGAEARVFDDMSHWLIGERGYEAVADACADFIDGLLAVPA